MKKFHHYEVSLEERVLEDFENAFIYYESISSTLSTNFTRMFQLAIGKLSVSPYNYLKISKKLRRISLGKFPYVLVYTIKDDVVIIAGLFHKASRPSNWRKKK